MKNKKKKILKSYYLCYKSPAFYLLFLCFVLPPMLALQTAYGLAFLPDLDLTLVTHRSNFFVLSPFFFPLGIDIFKATYLISLLSWNCNHLILCKAGFCSRYVDIYFYSLLAWSYNGFQPKLRKNSNFPFSSEIF